MGKSYEQQITVPIAPEHVAQRAAEVLAAIPKAGNVSVIPPVVRGDIAAFAGSTVTDLDTKLKDVKIPRATLGPCPVCGRTISENRKGYSCWSREDPGCGFVIWKSKAGKTLPIAVAFSHRNVLTERPIPSVPPAGLDTRGVSLPEGAFVLPIGHAASVRVALPHRPHSVLPGALPAGLPVVPPAGQARATS